MKALPLLVFTALLLGASAFSQQQPDRIDFKESQVGETPHNIRFWVGIMDKKNGCMTMIRLDQVISVSLHGYTVDGLAIREVTIDTTGNNTIRFYVSDNAQANKLAERMSNTKDLVNRNTGNAASLPAKKFPEGTHSHNVEYQVKNLETLNKIHDSIVNAVAKQRGCVLKID